MYFFIYIINIIAICSHIYIELSEIEHDVHIPLKIGIEIYSCASYFHRNATGRKKRKTSNFRKNSAYKNIKMKNFKWKKINSFDPVATEFCLKIQNQSSDWLNGNSILSLRVIQAKPPFSASVMQEISILPYVDYFIIISRLLS